MTHDPRLDATGACRFDGLATKDHLLVTPVTVVEESGLLQWGLQSLYRESVVMRRNE